MDEAENFDLKNLDSLRRDLKELRARAREDSAPGPEKTEQPDAAGGPAWRRPGAASAAEPGERGKRLASRLLALLRRGEDDQSPAVPGTDFTEQGVERLLDRLALLPKQSSAAGQFLHNMYRYLTAPPAEGAPMIADVSAEKIQYLSRFLPQIEKHGWNQVRSRMAQIRERPGARGTAARPEPKPAPQRRKRDGRRGGA